MNVQNFNHQQTPVSAPQQPSYQFVHTRKRFSMPKIPMIAQLSGLLSLLVIGAGLLTANQLSKTTQNLQSQAATGSVALDFEQPATATLALGQEKTFNIVATTTPTGLKASAAVFRLRTDKPDLIDVTGFTTVSTGFTVPLQPFAVGTNTPQLKDWSITLGADPQKTFSGKNNIVAVKVKAKNTAGTAELKIANTTEIAAFDNSSNVYDRALKSLTITVGGTPQAVCWNNVVGSGTDLNWPNSCKGTPRDPANPLVCTAGNIPLTADEKTQYNSWKQAGSVIPAGCGVSVDPSTFCTSKTAALVEIAQRTNLPANTKVRSNDIIEYTLNLALKSDTQQVTIRDAFPTALVDFVPGSVKIDGVQASTAPVTNNILRLDYQVGPAGRGKASKITYQVKVKAGLRDGDFTNHAEVSFNNSAAQSCEINLGITDQPRPTTGSPRLNLAFRIQGVTKAGVTIPAEITVRYHKKNSTEIVKKVFTADYTSTIPSSPQIGGPGTFMTTAPIILDGLNLSDVGPLPTSSSPGVEIFVKTPTTLRKKLGSNTFSATQLPTFLGGMYTSDAQRLIVGDFDRSTDQENKFRLTDVTKMMNQYTRVSTPVNDQNREYDINFDGTFNLVDVSQIIDNYRQILLEGETP